MIHVRRATGDDADWILGQLREFSHFFGTKHPLFPSDADVAASIVHAMIANLVFFIAVDHRTLEPQGFIAGAVGPHPMNPELKTFAEVFWWVTPSRRGSSAGARLLERFVEFGRANAQWVIMTLEAKSPVDPASLERRGFRLHERAYLMEVA
jgi:hypothetical protein